MFYRVQEVKPLPDMQLQVRFRGDAVKRYDVKPIMQQIPAFGALETVRGLFEQVKVDAGGYGVSWNDELDLSCNELWNKGKP